MSNYKKVLGGAGEKVAKFYLLKKGYDFLEQNFRFQKSEIDLIFKDVNDIVFVEVKTRRDIENIDYHSIVSHSQQSRIKNGANAFLDSIGGSYDEVRFDVVLISSNLKEIKYITNAF